MQEAAAVRNKIEYLLSRINALEELFATRPENVADQRRRNGLIWYAILSHELEIPRQVPSSMFKDIEGQLQSSYEKSRQWQPEDPQDRDEFSGPLEDLQEAISDYKVRS